MASDIQTGVSFGDGEILGTLKYITGWTAFSGNPEYQSGNYLAIHCDVNSDATVRVGLFPNQDGKGMMTLDADGLAVMRITNKDTQKVVVQATNVDSGIEKTYSLKGLVLQTE